MEAGNRQEQDHHHHHHHYFGATLVTHNFGSRSSQPDPVPRPPRYRHDQENHTNDQLHDHDRYPSTFIDSDSDYQSPVFESHRPLSPSHFASYAAINHHAANANATTTLEQPVGLVDPDQFYRTYDHELMASSLPVPRQPRDASTRLNSNGSSKHPAPPSTTRSALRPALRSSSAPVEDQGPSGAGRSRAATASNLIARNGHRPSVKDLKNKFDQGPGKTPNNTNRKTSNPPRIPARETSSPGGHQGISTSPATNGRTAYTTLRSSTTRDSPASASSTRSTQRNRSVPEDQLSSNAQSFASRISKPRASVGAHPQASKSMTNLSPSIPQESIPPIPQPRSLLFGEIVPGTLDTGLAGFGIEGVHTQSTSDPSVPGQTRQRSFSHTDVEPPSPSDWYRGMNGEPPDDANSSRPKPTKSHSRSRSDLAGTKSNPSGRSKTPQASRPTRPTLDTSSLTSSSKLPLSVRKLGTPSNSLSPSSTRSNSPTTARRRIPPPGKVPKSIPAVRAKTPTHVPNPPTKRPPRAGATTPNNNTRLNAYISSPPPKLSPPLRSSRPRQPVSTATTTSSRMKAVERERSPLRFESRNNPRANEQTPRRRKISMGPIDFESRREQIKLSYTRSIRDNEARASARKAAEEKRKKAEIEAVRAQIAAAEALKRQEERLQAELTDESPKSPIDTEVSPADSIAFRTITTGLFAESPADSIAPAREKVPLKAIETELISSRNPEASHSVESELPIESPTLGIPGSFPTVETPDDQEEAPQSAISNTTEFDGEAQTEPPVQELSIRQEVSTFLDSDTYTSPAHPISEYRSPFEDESPQGDDVSIKVSFDDSAEVNPRPGKGSAITPLAEQDIALHKEAEFEPKSPESMSYQTKVTILGRDADFLPATRKTESLAEFVGRSEKLEDSTAKLHNLHFSPQVSQVDRTGPNDEHPDPSAGLSDIEEFFVGPIMEDSMIRPGEVANRPVRYTSEDANQNPTDEPRFSVESRRTIGTRPSLTVPRTSESVNRISQTTVWTDYSMSSQDRYSHFDVKDETPREGEQPYHDDRAVLESDSGSQIYRYDGHFRDSSHNRGVSPHGTCRETETESVLDHQHQLPEIDTGGGFVVDYATRKNSTTISSIPLRPDHAPPPPPSDIVSLRDAMSSAPPSEYFDDTRPNSYLRAGRDDQSVFSVDPSRRESRDSEDFAHPRSATQSIDQGSLATSDGQHSSSSRLASQQTLIESISIEQTAEAQGLEPKERKRLFTRLETIKELVDTEAFFVRDMNIVEEIYKGTAEACPKLDDQTIKLIFRNTDEIIRFHSGFGAELKQGVSSVYTPKAHRNLPKEKASSMNDGTASLASSTPATGHLSDEKDRETSLGPIFIRNIEKMKTVHETFLKNSDHAAKQLIRIQEDPTVQVWLNECNEVARELTKAWNLDSLLIKPMQRITKYPNLIIQLLHETPADHPDRPSLESAKASLETAIEDINKTKKNFELVGQIVGRKRKESDVKAGFARAFGKRVDKLQAAANRPSEDPEYLKLHEKFGDDYLRLQVVLRDVEFYTRQVAEHVHEFLQYLSSMELVMRLQPSPHPEIESKWVRFNVSMRDIEKVALEQHLSKVRKQVIEPFEQVIKSYDNPSLAMKKRGKRRLDYEKSISLKKSGKKVDKQLAEFVEQYEALNEALKKELPKLSMLTEKVGNICLGKFVNIQTDWFAIWKEKVKMGLDIASVPEVHEIVSTFQRDYQFQDDQMNALDILNPVSKGRPSQSTSTNESIGRLRPRPTDLSTRSRGLSINSDMAPTLPTPDFMKRHSGQFTVSPAAVPSPHQYYYRDVYSGSNTHTRPGSNASNTPDMSVGSRSLATPSARPGTGQSYESSGAPRQSVESMSRSRRYSNTMYASPYQIPDNQRFSGIFQSALPVSEGQDRPPRPSQASSRASSHERQPVNGYNVLWLAASLFEFNIETTKHEAGYPYLTYQAGEIFDVIAEKGELWLAKNQDDPSNVVGWLWSKHFAKLADD
ncbi:hypothetical protein F5Y15DRAFT_361561 [Xylariaceae sp. FL0016]|nr:hypothetical protein F5Y15DRAFT_361561 [Xylariaceae sp. FL0016]